MGYQEASLQWAMAGYRLAAWQQFQGWAVRRTPPGMTG
jgi:hypothetical protein